MDELLLVDKPTGITSFDVIRRLRKEYREQGEQSPKLGHGGTLDPAASGLMIIGVGSGTKKLQEYLKLPKEYVAEIRVGERRSTGDMDGTVIETTPVRELDESQIRSVLSEMVGILTLPVSAYSAIKKDGVPMYKRARKAEKAGEEVTELPMRDMEVMVAEYGGHYCADSVCVVTVRFYVGSGTYIRSLAEEFGRRLGYPATLESLRRTKIGEFDIADARTISDFKDK